MGNDQSSNRGDGDGDGGASYDGNAHYAQGDGAHMVAWDRSIGGEGNTVQREVEYIHKHYPDAKIHIASGVHGGPGQASYGSPEKDFYDNDCRNNGDKSYVDVHDVGCSQGRRDFREAVKVKDDYGVVANCNGKDNKDYTTAEKTCLDGSRDMRYASNRGHSKNG